MSTTDTPRGPSSDWVLALIYLVFAAVLTGLIAAAASGLPAASEGLQPLVEWWTGVRS